MKIGVHLTEPERIWLQEVYRRYTKGESIDPWRLRIELREKLPKDFLPSQVSGQLSWGRTITLLGILAVDPESERIRDSERVIITI